MKRTIVLLIAGVLLGIPTVASAQQVLKFKKEFLTTHCGFVTSKQGEEGEIEIDDLLITFNALAHKIARRPVTCEDLGRGRHKRIIARCTVAGDDLGEWMVAQGWAVAYYLFSYEYSRAEHRAESARRGIWASEFVKPWESRRGKRLDTGN